MSAGVLRGMGLDGAPGWRSPAADRAPGGAALLSLLAHLGAGALVILAMTPQGPRMGGVPSSTPGLVPIEIAFAPAAGAAPDHSRQAGPPAEAGPALPALDTPPPPIPVPESPPFEQAPPPVPAPLPHLPDETLALTMPSPPVATSPAPPQPLDAPKPIPAEAPPTKPEPPMATAAPTPRPPPVSRPAQASLRPAAPSRRAGGPGPAASGESTPTDAAAQAGAPLAFSPPLITAARFRRPPRPPDYPPRAIELDLNGTVLIRALLDPEGDPREVRVHRSSGHALLDHAAVAAVSRWAFEPASREGQRIPAWVEVPVHFRLH